MPIYEFRCKYCQHQEEILQKVNDPIPESCHACGRNLGLEKVVSHTSFQLKGGGWYNEGYASPKPACAKASAGEPACKTPCQAPEA